MQFVLVIVMIIIELNVFTEIVVNMNLPQYITDTYSRVPQDISV